jgi:transcription-repair coupling factor (superfamily II helicase)
VRVEVEWDTVGSIYTFDREAKRVLASYQVLLIVPRLKRKKYKENMPIDAFLDFKEGDYIVHNNYGIGKFLGKKTIDSHGRKGLFFEVEYRNSDKVYIPVEKAELLQKYVSFGLKEPRLSRLGTKEWSRLKENARKGIRRFALELVRTQAAREVISGFKFSKDSKWQHIFEDKFPYQLTPCQEEGVRLVKEDMESRHIMDRLICGDVGFGKTEIDFPRSSSSIP